MRLTCPNCGARYEVDDALIPPEGRDVQCSDCFTIWFQAGPRKPHMAPPPPRPPLVEEPTPEPEVAPDQAEETPSDPVSDVAEDEGSPTGTIADPEPEPVPAAAEPESDAPSAEPEVQASDVPEPDQDTAVEVPEDVVDSEVASGTEGTSAEPEEDTLIEIPQSAENATQVVAENDHPEPEEEDDAERSAESTGRREIDPDVRDILKSEAERESRLRKAEADPVETQAEMPLEQSSDDAERARRRAELEDAQDAFTVASASAGHANGSRRDLLPDIEEINSTLRATEDRGTPEGDDTAELERLAARQRRRGVRVGFFLTLALTVGLIWVYFNAGTLSENVPGVAGAVEGFADQVDMARFWLDDLARGLATSEEGS